MSRVNACHQSLITQYSSQPQAANANAANALANITAEPGKDEKDVDDLLGLLQEEDIPMDFEGFEARLHTVLVMRKWWRRERVTSSHHSPPLPG